MRDEVRGKRVFDTDLLFLSTLVSGQTVNYAGPYYNALSGPQQPIQPVVAGWSAGIGATIVLSNAQNAQQYANIGPTINVSFGMLWQGSVSLGWSTDFSTYSLGIQPLGLGGGLSASVTTGTTVVATGGCRP